MYESSHEVTRLRLWLQLIKVEVLYISQVLSEYGHVRVVCWVVTTHDGAD